MTADRPTASPRAATLNQRPAALAAGRQPDVPTDAFSALLGAARPRTEDAPRHEPSRGRRDDGPRPSRRDDVKSKPVEDQPKADAPTESVPEEPTEDAPRLVTPDIFALQLASPLPATPAVPATPVPTAGLPVVEGEAQPAQPALPTFTSANLALTGQVPVVAPPTGEAPTVELTPTAPPVPTPGAGTPGGIPLPTLTGLTPASQADVPPIELPATPPVQAPAEAAAVTPHADVAVAAPNAGGQTASSDTPQQQNPQGSTPNTAAQQAKPAEAPAPTTAQPLTPTAPVVQAVPLTQAAAVERAVPLYRAPETAAALIKLAADRGITHAKLNLKPAELGGIEVRLKQSPLGITAHLVADSPEAAKLLTQASDDLRRDLASRDVNLLSLDVSTQQQYQDQQAGAKQADIFGDDHQPGRALRFGPQGDSGLAETAAAADTSLVLPNGVLVDVLA
jgi:hypothetical protein